MQTYKVTEKVQERKKTEFHLLESDTSVFLEEFLHPLNLSIFAQEVFQVQRCLLIFLTQAYNQCDPIQVQLGLKDQFFCLLYNV